MKRVLLIKKGVFALLLALFLGMGTAYAYDFSVVVSGKTFYFNLIDATHHYVEVTYPGTYSNPYGGFTKPTGNISIPDGFYSGSTLYTVTKIGDRAFYGCSGLTGSLTIPSTVNSIGVDAFYNCSGFSGSLSVPNSVTTIGSWAFSNCGFTGSLTIGNGVTVIGAYAFYQCVSFTGSLTLGSSVTSIGQYAFQNCAGFTGSLTIPSSVTTIDNNAFQNCFGFTGTLTLGSSLTSIGDKAFYNCNKFTGSLTIPSSVTTIGSEAFYYCNGFTGILTIGTGVTSIGASAFKNCTGFTQVKFNAVNCQDLEDEYVKPFEGCTATTLTIGSSVQRIPAYMFYQCTNFTGSLNIPNSVAEIGDFAFFTTGFNGSLTLGSSLTTIGQSAFYGCVNFTGSLTIPNSVTTLGNGAFTFCMGFTGLTLGSSLTSIGDVAFALCTGFTGSLAIPNSVTTIGTGAFGSCTGFTGSLTIGNNVTTIGEQAFQNCGFTGALTIGSSVSSIDSYALSCPNISSMTVLPETPPTLGEDAFEDVPTSIPVYVPCPSLEDYQSASGWSNFTNMQCFEALSVFDGTATNGYVPVYGFYADAYLKAEFVMPSTELVEMVGCDIVNMKFYATSPASDRWTSTFRVFMKEVFDASINAFSGTGGATVVYEGLLDGTGSEMTIHFNTPYHYNGGNLLVGVYNITKGNYKAVTWAGVTATDASVQGYDYTSLEAIEPTQQNFIPKTTFVYMPICEPQSLPYTYGFEEGDEFDCWTMLRCNPSTGRYTASSSYPAHQGSYGFRFQYNTNPPQYLISPKFEGTTPMDVSFYYKIQSTSFPETFQVGYSTTTKSPDAFIWGDQVTANNASSWMLYEDFFPEGTKYVAVKLNSYDKWFLYLDDFSFTPAFCPPEDRCELTFTLTDSYGDGWNGAALDVYDAATNILLASLSAPNHGLSNSSTTDTYTLAVCDGRELRFEWVSGSWNGECSYTVTDVNGIEIFSGTGAMSGPVTYLVDCTQQYVFLTDGNWNNGSCWNTGTVPPAGSDVVIQANVTVPAGYFAVANTVTLDGGSITVADGGQLKHNTPGLEVTMKKNIVGYDDANDIRNYYLLAFPFVYTGIPAAMSATGSDFYRFDPSEPNAEWRNLRSEPFYIDIAHGYLFASPESFELSLTSNTYSSTTEMSWDYVVEYTEGSANPYDGWELLGNPFTYNAYIYRETSDGELVPMPIMMYDANGDLQTVYGGPVAPMQGFFVHVTETTTVCFRGTALHEDDYVDLGLPSGLLWATFNVGADSPEDYGDHFAWGETTPKDTYNWSTYQYCNGSYNTLTKYCNYSSCGYNGFTDDLTTLLPEDDAAAANWGGNWRMPTKEEFQELYNNTTVTWTQQNGVNGRLFTAPNGNTLFLPAAGYRYNSSLNDAGSNGDYWSSSLYTDGPYGAWDFDFDSDNYGMDGYYRYYGFTVRPVRSPQTEHAYVDLGLPSGTKWATCNVGADSPEDYGDYFAWGETTPKETYNWATYQYCNGSQNTLTKYCSDASYGYNGFTDDLTTLLPEDDAATANWGPDWRMPTDEEWQELYDNTTHTWTTQNGVYGRLFTATNGNSLFLPAAGYRGSSSLQYAGSHGNYWSSSLNTDDPYRAWYFYFSSGDFGLYYTGRLAGQSVRAVRVGSQN